MSIPRVLLVAFPVVVLAMSAAEARDIENACNKSSRRGVSSQLCGCIQSVADQTLTGRGDQKLAAKFFADPQMAQDIRQSDRRSHSEFWQRYRIFGNVAQQRCS